MKIISWNINSLRLRLPLLKKIIEESRADIICLQETKVEDSLFPLKELNMLGFDFVEFSGEKSYNGVAILSKFPLSLVNKVDVLGYGHKRHISATIHTKSGNEVILHNFYVPAGGDIPDIIINNKFDHKLKFVDWMADFFKIEHQTSNQKIVVVGDFNIAPMASDVWSHRQLLKVVSHTPIEIEKLNNLKQSINFIDSHRMLAGDEEKLYSWWSYRASNPLESNRGRRLDHIWISQNLKQNIESFKIYTNYRLENQPSDHVPIQTNLINL